MRSPTCFTLFFTKSRIYPTTCAGMTAIRLEQTIKIIPKITRHLYLTKYLLSAFKCLNMKGKGTKEYLKAKEKQKAQGKKRKAALCLRLYPPHYPLMTNIHFQDLFKMLLRPDFLF